MELQALVVNVENYVRYHLPRYIEELGQICLIDTPSSYQSGLYKLVQWLGKRMSDLGMHVITIDYGREGCDLSGTIQGCGQHTIALLGHIDTVYAVGTAALRPLYRQGNVIHAPGAADMKGGILLALYAIEALLATGYHSFGEIRFLCVSDEETSQRHSVDLIQQVCLGCQAVFVLEAAQENGNIVSARKGTAWYTLTARGRSAHAGVEPEKGCNAVIELAHQILQFQSLHAWHEGISICPGVISGGSLPNVVPDHAQARFDLRFLHPSDRNSVEKRWKEMLQQQRVPGVELTLELEAYRDPMICLPASLKLVHKAQAIARMLGISIDHVLSGGTSDARYPSALGIPVIDGLGPIGGLDHSPGEYIMLDSIASRTALLAGLVAVGNR